MKDLHKGFMFGFAVGYMLMLILLTYSKSQQQKIHEAEIKSMEERYNKLQSRCDSAYYAERLQVIEKAFNKVAGK